jgi:hypothetical protein
MAMSRKSFGWLSLGGYTLMGSASAGYYGYFLKHQDSFLIQWIILGFIGCICLAIKNVFLYRSCHTYKFLWDVPIILLIWTLPLAPMPYGLSIVMMIIICSVLFVGITFHLSKLI